LSQDVDLNGDVDVDSILDLAGRPSAALRILVEQSRPMANVDVDDGLHVHGHVKRNDGRRRQPGDAPEVGPPPFVRHLLSQGVASGRASAALRILVEQSRPMANVEVDDGLHVHGHVKRNDGRRRQPGDAPEVGPTPFVRHFLSQGVA